MSLMNRRNFVKSVTGASVTSFLMSHTSAAWAGVSHEADQQQEGRISFYPLIP
jgi:hypothetical protein